MKYYFEDIDKQKQLLDILESWIGTPYRHRCGVKQMGCDCIHLHIAILTELGLLHLKPKDIPHYPRDYHIHSTRSLMVESIEKYLNVEKVNNLMNGDILCFKFGKAAGHAAFWFNGYLYESLNKMGVVKTNFNNSQWKNKLTNTFRILEIS